jgi:hypothetical protein
MGSMCSRLGTFTKICKLSATHLTYLQHTLSKMSPSCNVYGRLETFTKMSPSCNVYGRLETFSKMSPSCNVYGRLETFTKMSPSCNVYGRLETFTKMSPSSNRVNFKQEQTNICCDAKFLSRSIHRKHVIQSVQQNRTDAEAVCNTQ